MPYCSLRWLHLLFFLQLFATDLSASVSLETLDFVGEYRNVDGLSGVNQWFRRHKFVFHKNTQIKWSSTKGIYVHQNGTISATSEVIRCPSHMLLPPWLPKGRHKGLLQSFAEKERLMIRLIHEIQKGSQSKWFGYFKMLPKAEELEAFPVFWDSGVQDTYTELQGTYFSSLLQLKIDKLHKFYKRLLNAGIFKKLPSFELVKWAVAIVDSRSFRISKVRGTHRLNNKAFLAPLADLLNHDPNAQVGWKLGPDKGSANRNRKSKTYFRIFSIDEQEYEPGKEFYNTYNTATSSADFLLHYGFVPSPSKRDYLPLELSLPRDDGLYRERENLRKILNISTSARFYYGQPTPEYLPKLLCLIMLEGSELKNILNSEDASAKFLTYVEDKKVKNLEAMKSSLMSLKRNLRIETQGQVEFSINAILKLEQSIINHHIDQIDTLFSGEGREAFEDEL